jgi:hypothetical protein
MMNNVPLGQLGTKDQEPIIYTTQDAGENHHDYPPNKNEHINGLSSNTETTKIPPAQQPIGTEEISFRSSALN